MIIIHAQFKVKSEQRKAFLSATKPLIAGSQAEKGNISYNLVENVQEANTFMMIEKWQDQKAVDVHNQTKHFVHFGSISAPFFDAPTKVTLFQAEKKQ